MFLLNRHSDDRKPLDPADAETLGPQGTDAVERFLVQRDNEPCRKADRPKSLAASRERRSKSGCAATGSEFFHQFH